MIPASPPSNARRVKPGTSYTVDLTDPVQAWSVNGCDLFEPPVAPLRRTGCGRPCSPTRTGWRPRCGDSSGPRPACPDQATHRRLRRCHRVLLSVGLSHHHPPDPRIAHRRHRRAAVLSPTRGTPLPSVDDGCRGDGRGAARPSPESERRAPTSTRPQCRPGPRTGWRSYQLYNEPFRLGRPPFRFLRLLQLHMVALARRAVLPAVAIRAALDLSSQSSAVRRGHPVAHRNQPDA